MNPLISVIVPIYNVEKYLARCVDSIVNQTYKNLEIILVDDGSTDTSPNLCDEWAEKDNRIKVIHKTNGGLSSARNTGIEAATGDYILFLDSDDYWTYSDLLADLADIIKKRDPSVTIFGYTADMKLINNYARNTTLEQKVSFGTKLEAFRNLICNNKLQSSACNKVYRSSLLKADSIMFEEGIFSEDIDWTARVIIAADKIALLDKYAYYYRVNGSSITHNISEKNMNDLANNVVKVVKLGDTIQSEDYYEYYMNYCSYQYITLLNLLSQGYGDGSREKLLKLAKEYAWLLKYHINKKVKIVYYCKKLFGFSGMMKILGKFLKGRSRY